MSLQFDNVFVIDDDTASQFVCEKVINFLNLTKNLKFYDNGEEALKFFSEYLKKENDLPDLILLDLDMPVMDGFQFIKAIKKHKIYSMNLHIAILATTSSYSSKVQTIKQMGIQYYIAKPLNIDKMKEFCEQLQQADPQNFLFIN